MTFAETLKGYQDELCCSAKALAQASGVSTSNVSRYLSGERVPAAGSETVQRLAAGIAALAEQADHAELDQASVVAELEHALTGIETDYDTFARKFRSLMDGLDINGNRLARALGFDPSYISRIQSGQRRPADLPRFIDGVSDYVARNSDATAFAQLTLLCGDDALEPGDTAGIARAVRAYLGSGAGVASEPQGLERFLRTLDAFSLNDYLRSVHFDEIKVPSVPLQLPGTKTYRGIEQMKQAELDFLKAAVLSKRNDDVILYSDMPMEEMARDKDFAKNVMLGMGMLVKKGVQLLNIHDVHRPLRELIMGLEGWLPLYMTGRITGYYLEQPTNQVFLHFLRSAGSVAAYGEAIAGDHAGGRYVVTKTASEVAYHRSRAQELLALAKPLMRTFLEGDEARLEAELRAHELAAGREADKIAEGVFKNVSISVLTGRYALVTKEDEPKTYMLIEHPTLVNAFARYTPTLF
ncbi:MAG: helix-turn-helix transcriptional regulator [Coriobacteriales bacterium]|nr:helix-turn-helix transcriptional regulator [Coriobacteriales bacterium]